MKYTHWIGVVVLIFVCIWVSNNVSAVQNVVG